MLLRDLQRLLGSLYGLDLAHDVHDYLVTDEDLLKLLERGTAARETAEKLLIVQGEDGIDVALYLARDVLERLHAADPRQALGGHNLNDFWTVLEGISHFNYLAWNAAADRCVTLMELEMQAEVDKYLGTRWLLARQPGADLGGPLLRRLFEDTVLHADLGAEERARYRDASHLAGRYCHSLESRYPDSALALDMLRELRQFYRLPQPAKVSHIHSKHLG